MFKPNLIPNNPKDGSFTREDLSATINKNGGAARYIVNRKKDGVRLELGFVPIPVGRSLKKVPNQQLNDRFAELNTWLYDRGIIVEGEFFSRALKLNQIMKFYSKQDVEDPDYYRQLRKLKETKPDKYADDYGDLSPEYFTTFHKDLRFWMFDVYYKDAPNAGFRDRMHRFFSQTVKEIPMRMLEFLVFPDMREFETPQQIFDFYDKAVEEGWEGLVLTHEDHKYKFGRNSIKQGTLLKMKDEDNEWDAVVLDVEEGTVVKDGVETTTNELGRSVTSKKKDDREPSGMAKGFVVQFEDKGTFTVGLRGFDHEDRRELLENKDKYIGRHFKFTGMQPLKDFPRHAYFKMWRDEK